MEKTIEVNGKKIGLATPGPLHELDLVGVLGDKAENRVYLTMMYPIIYVASIDGSAVPQPASFNEARALYARLDGCMREISIAATELADKPEVKSAKKSQGTQPLEKS